MSGSALPEIDPPCPVRAGEPCRLCVPGASGPATCGLAYLVRSDSDINERAQAAWREAYAVELGGE